MAGLNDFPVGGVLRAEDIHRAERFYTQVLGLTEVPAPGQGGAYFRTGTGAMVMIYEQPNIPAPQNTTLGFSVPAEKFDQVVSELRGKGVVFEDYDIPDMGIKTTNGIAYMGDSKAAWFKDPEGNILNIATM